MIKLRYRLQFHTPAFVGGADQGSQWRTPGIKAALRQWWRVAHAASHGHALSVDAMRREEDALFGTAAAAGDGKARRSSMRLRLDTWRDGSLKNWPALDGMAIRHPEVRSPVDAHLYLGFGPLTNSQRRSVLKAAPAIAAGEHALLSIALPDDDRAGAVRQALGLMHLHGTVGGRSRNGWGSFSLAGHADTLSPDEDAAIAAVCRPWRDALRLDWAHAVGLDAQARPLIWATTVEFADWTRLMRRLAEIKISLRTQFIFTSGKDAPRPEGRHWLSYPVTNHGVRAWGNRRLPNSLRFKVRRTAAGRLVGVIAHWPCRPPDEFGSNAPTLEAVWQRVHDHLDGVADLERIPA